MSKFIIDSSAFLAMLDAKDKYHHQAQSFLSKNNNALFCVPVPIFAETMTLVKARLGSKAAISLGESIFISPLFQLVALPEDEIQTIWIIFKKYDDKGWSYADCSILAVAQYVQIDTIFSFDHHIEQMVNLHRVP